MHIISVRRLVEFILRSGDIDNRMKAAADVDAMQQGSAVHRMLQREGGASYNAEVPLKINAVLKDGLNITVEGRADGIIEEEDGSITIDEIKGTFSDLKFIREPAAVHIAQASCYAYIYGLQNDLDKVNVRMTYVNMESKKVKRFSETKNVSELEAWFYDVLEKYGIWVRMMEKHCFERDETIACASFPFKYRPGQKNLVSGIYQTIKQGRRLFAQAPTGTGKTVAAVFPAVKAMGDGIAEKIFYLTAKTITRTVAIDTMKILEEQGIKVSFSALTAKEKICIKQECTCNPEACERAEGHFDRVNDAVFDMVTHEAAITMDVILEYADKYRVCPFEMQLDGALWVDSIVCDYNYLFDPNVYLKRFFSDKKENYLFIVDEAHNLIDRAREMYSAAIYKTHFLQLKKIVKTFEPELGKQLEKCNKAMLALKNEAGSFSRLDNCGTIPVCLMRLMTVLDDFLKSDMSDELREAILDVYFEVRDFLRVIDAYDDRYVVYGQSLPGNEFMLKIMCVDPSKDLGERLDLGRSTVFLSATLLPIDYYKELLSTTGDNDYDLYIDSPFSQENRLILAANDVSSLYKRRNAEEFLKIADYIKDIANAKTGNYIAFFPSYTYMNSVYEIFDEKYGNVFKLIKQENYMSEKDRQEFLDRFDERPSETMIAFCVLGGIFSEGIDLKEERLIGAIIIGTGLPQVSEERELIKDWFEAHSRNGFNHAYMYPGMNKVMQAAGRVIRTEEDKGIIALLDERFNHSRYRCLFPKEWFPYIKVSKNSAGKAAEDFWGND